MSIFEFGGCVTLCPITCPCLHTCVLQKEIGSFGCGKTTLLYFQNVFKSERREEYWQDRVEEPINGTFAHACDSTRSGNIFSSQKYETCTLSCNLRSTGMPSTENTLTSSHGKKQRKLVPSITRNTYECLMILSRCWEFLVEATQSPWTSLVASFGQTAVLKECKQKKFINFTH